MSFTWKPKSSSQGLRGKMGTLALPNTFYMSKTSITGPQKLTLCEHHPVKSYINQSRGRQGKKECNSTLVPFEDLWPI
jgi:hypothetical protein